MNLNEIDENILQCAIFPQFYKVQIKYLLAFVSKKMCTISQVKSLEYMKSPIDPKIHMKKIEPGYYYAKLLWNNYVKDMLNLVHSVPEVNRMICIKQFKRCISDIHSVGFYFAKGCGIYMNNKNNGLFIHNMKN